MQADRHLGACYKCREVYPCGAYTSLRSIGARGRGRQLCSLAFSLRRVLRHLIRRQLSAVRPLHRRGFVRAWPFVRVRQGGRQRIDEPARIVGFRPGYNPRRVPPLLSGVSTTADHSGKPRLSVGAGRPSQSLANFVLGRRAVAAVVGSHVHQWLPSAPAWLLGRDCQTAWGRLADPCAGCLSLPSIFPPTRD